MAIMKKKVDITIHGVLVNVFPKTVRGNCKNEVLTVGQIKIALEQNCRVYEILPNGERLPLTFANYDKDNRDAANKKVVIEEPKATPAAVLVETEKLKDAKVEQKQPEPVKTEETKQEVQPEQPQQEEVQPNTQEKQEATKISEMNNNKKDGAFHQQNKGNYKK